MKAIRIHEHGDRTKITIDEITKPKPNDDEVLVKIKSTALNHLDLFVREGIPGVPLPIILGSDGAGVVSETGVRVKEGRKWREGDGVIIAPVRSCGLCYNCVSGHDNLCRDFQIPGEHFDGTQAEFVAVPQRYLLRKPNRLNWEEAAALPLVTMTAYHMLIRKVRIIPGDWILIYGASSGVGGMAIQIARQLGARIITTAGNESKARAAEKLGAEYVIRYDKDKVGQTAKAITQGAGVDVVLEHTGAETWYESLRALKKGGTIVTCGATTGPKVTIDLRALFIKHQRLIGSTMGTLQDLHEIVQWVEQNRLSPYVDTVFDFKDIKEAHEWLESGQQFGKVVVRFND